MNVSVKRIGAVAAFLFSGSVALCPRSETKAADSKTPIALEFVLPNPDAKTANTWNQKAAAAYLDQRQSWWMEWPRAARDHGTFCISCHTALPYALSRSALRLPLGEESPSVNERALLDNVSKRVRLWKEVAPFYTDADRGEHKTVESRGTESVLNALILAANDGRTGQLSNDTSAALDNMWSEQQTTGSKKGAWPWLRFNNEPWEADDSDYYGATLAAAAVGMAPGNYRDASRIQTNLTMLREYLLRESAAQTTINRIALLWASSKLPGLLDATHQEAIINEVLAKQLSDGGWSLSSLAGPWKRADGTPQEMTSDGYATGLIAFALQQSGISRENPQLKHALAWLAANQSKTDGSWQSSSLNKNVQHHQSPQTVQFMNDAATAYAVLALSESARR
jgi:squalene-hopene/tetraprenyl-beta-curcumene cyclase